MLPGDRREVQNIQRQEVLKQRLNTFFEELGIGVDSDDADFLRDVYINVFSVVNDDNLEVADLPAAITILREVEAEIKRIREVAQGLLAGDMALSRYDAVFTNAIKKIIEKYEVMQTPSAPATPTPTSVEMSSAWEEDFRPVERQHWQPEDYINYAFSELSLPASEIELAGGTKLRTEFNRLVDLHPRYKSKAKYWKAVFNTATVLWKANPPTNDSFSVNVGAYHEKSLQEGGFEVTNVWDVLGDKDYGYAIMRILALIEFCLYDAGVGNEDQNFEYTAQDGTTKIITKGQFVARSMDNNQNNLEKAIKAIVKDAGWLDGLLVQDPDSEPDSETVGRKYLIDFLVDHAFRLSNALDSRGHFFLNDTAAAVTKGFGGVDYTWEVAPQFTVGYDRNRYGREPSASHYLLAVIGFPNEWHKQAAHNMFFTSKGAMNLKSDDVVNFIRQSVADSTKKSGYYLSNSEINVLNNFLLEKEKIDDGIINDFSANIKNRMGPIILKMEEHSAKARIEAGEEEVERIRHWFHNFISEKDVRLCLEKASNDKDKIVGQYSVPFFLETKKDKNGKQKTEYVFNPEGPTFPTIYEFYVGQLMKRNKFTNGKVVSSGLTEEIIMDTDLFNDWAKENINKKDELLRFAVLNQYLIARSGWLDVLDTIKQPVSPVSGEDLLRKIDTFLSNLGKAKIVPGAHHNMMNVVSLLYMVKLFKYLEPRSYAEFDRVRNLALKKVSNQDTSQAGGGVPPQVKTYLTWLLEEAKSSHRSFDRPGDMLRPMNPSHDEKREQEIEEATRGMKRGVFRTYRSGLISLETILKEVVHTETEKGKSDIPSGPIKWAEQDTSTKAGGAK